MPDPTDLIRRTPLQQADEATQLAREALAAGDMVTGSAAIVLASQLIQIARLWDTAAALRARKGCG